MLHSVYKSLQYNISIYKIWRYDDWRFFVVDISSLWRKEASSQFSRRDNRENRATRKMETEYIIGRRASQDFVKFRTKYLLLSSDNNSNSLVIYRETLATALSVITAITRKLRCFLVSLRILLKEILLKKHSPRLLECNVTFVKRQSARIP